MGDRHLIKTGNSFKIRDIPAFDVTSINHQLRLMESVKTQNVLMRLNHHTRQCFLYLWFNGWIKRLLLKNWIKEKLLIKKNYLQIKTKELTSNQKTLLFNTLVVQKHFLEYNQDNVSDCKYNTELYIFLEYFCCEKLCRFVTVFQILDNARHIHQLIMTYEIELCKILQNLKVTDTYMSIKGKINSSWLIWGI